MVGVLALQGNFDSHIKILEKINLKHKLVKTSDDLSFPNFEIEIDWEASE